MADQPAPDPGAFGSMVMTGECEVIPGPRDEQVDGVECADEDGEN